MEAIRQIFEDPANYKKFFAALAGALVQLVIVIAPTETQAAFAVTDTEWYTVIVAAVTALGVERVANDRYFSWK